jgi:hypothetical protein
MEEFRAGMLRDLARWRTEIAALGPDPRWEDIRKQLLAFIEAGEGLLKPL